MTNKPFIIQLSNKTEVKIDSDELENVLKGISTGSPIRVKRGIVNPSFIVDIVGDMQRWEKIYDGITGLYDSPEYVLEKQRRADVGCIPLIDIFARTPLAFDRKNLKELS